LVRRDAELATCAGCPARLVGGAKLQKWDTLSADEKKLFIRQADVFAAYTAYTDYEIGRVIQAVEDAGQLDNTLIIFVSGDNGCSAEGSILGTPNDMAAIQGVNVPVPDQLKFYDVWGSALTTPHMAVAWAWAFDTPFKWLKQVASHFGGTRQGMAISWPRSHQRARRHPHAVSPLDRHRTDHPRSTVARAVVSGAQKPIEGGAPHLDKKNANAPSANQYLRWSHPRDLPKGRVAYHPSAGFGLASFLCGQTAILGALQYRDDTADKDLVAKT
jgi:arylsulfatase